MPERFHDDLLCDLCGLRAIGMSTHAVDHDQQRRALGHHRRDPILVLFAPAQQADLRVLDPQEKFHASVRLVGAFISPVTNASMIASMTGFARRESTGTWGTLVCELRSVNHRFLEAGFRLPDELRAAEPELRQRLSRAVRRGKVDCSISYRRSQGSENALEVDAQALERVLVRVRDIARVVPENHTVNVL